MTLFCDLGIELRDEDLKLSEQVAIHYGELSMTPEAIQMFPAIFGIAYFRKTLSNKLFVEKDTHGQL